MHALYHCLVVFFVQCDAVRSLGILCSCVVVGGIYVGGSRVVAALANTKDRGFRARRFPSPIGRNRKKSRHNAFFSVCPIPDFAPFLFLFFDPFDQGRATPPWRSLFFILGVWGTRASQRKKGTDRKPIAPLFSLGLYGVWVAAPFFTPFVVPSLFFRFAIGRLPVRSRAGADERTTKKRRRDDDCASDDNRSKGRARNGLPGHHAVRNPHAYPVCPSRPEPGRGRRHVPRALRRGGRL
ncbi:hypothetical protein [Pandoravirus japonicus]|uniref:Uncharacterized protein n=1 Tax=Pandoravirus japonicus TaxID=2823154 RepID=A0A811BNJ7_9VIRU|nr:hypothetical protein [Pandoravirus japonicus]